MVNIGVQWMMTAMLSLFHPFFVSVIEINHNAKESDLEISVRIFTNDFEKTLVKNNPGKIDILNPADPALLEKQIGTYLSKHIRLKVNGQPMALNYLGHEIQKESVWSYLEIPKVKELKKLEIDCDLLYDFETAQSNIIHVKNGNQDKSYKLDYPKRNTVFDF
jgi:hypothetical protein